ncbi:hypothetical protein [Enterobacter roggenkampii]|uniref:hypothetical protein n=1 Tax=Enterobacter roggenkampii TaxID=1812935 RepID=UPI000798954A|nr:hypothetical protein [Enterobacter roggenkampii]MBA7742057.1 hypothetical protein [Enterobacter roggenkampii]MBT2030175.1 hypothetical protein [Enterobacter roggenkampii]MBT2034719.1 hypothetical protein [Enterobacter roggenkampii]SAA31665.1 Uncharacterised protein [Enterobacter roggenkampii]HCR0802767.1 hypothetical protein [Enterobacter roggenkampii]
MSTITRERIEQLANGNNICKVTREERIELARIALASLEAEPVGYMNRFTGRVFTLEEQPGADTDAQVYVPVYAAPPAPECLTRPVHPRISSEELDDETLDELIDFRRCTFEYHSQQDNKVQTIIHGVTLTAMLELRDRRAAMLQGGDGNSPVIPDGWVMVPVEPTEDMIVNGFESEPDESFSDEKEWATYDAMSGCQQAAHRAKLCWAAMIAAAPKTEHK